MPYIAIGGDHQAGRGHIVEDNRAHWDALDTPQQPVETDSNKENKENMPVSGRSSYVSQKSQGSFPFALKNSMNQRQISLGPDEPDFEKFKRDLEARNVIVTGELEPRDDSNTTATIPELPARSENRMTRIFEGDILQPRKQRANQSATPVSRSSARSVRPPSIIQQPQTGPLGGSRRASATSTYSLAPSRSPVDSDQADPSHAQSVQTSISGAKRSLSPQHPLMGIYRHQNRSSSVSVATAPVNSSPQSNAANTSVGSLSGIPYTNPSAAAHQRKPSIASTFYAQHQASASKASLAPSVLASRRLSSTPTVSSIAPSQVQSVDDESRKSFMGFRHGTLRNRPEVLAARKSMSDIRRSIIGASSSLFRGNTERPAVDRSMISLPTPADESRDKLRNKLKASASLLSLSQDYGSEVTGVPVFEHEKIKLQELLDLATVHEIVSLYNIFAPLGKVRKIREQDSREVYFPVQTSNQELCIYTLAAFGDDQVPIQSVVHDLRMQNLTMTIEGFAQITQSMVARGKTTSDLLAAWDNFAEYFKTALPRPDTFGDNQLYCITAMSHPGEALETFSLNNWGEALEIFWQVARYLANAERQLQFEHRDLHWGNIMIRREVSGHVVATIVESTYGRLQDPNGSVLFTRLDHPNFHKGQGDYQFVIYQMMQKLLMDQSPNKTDPNWSAFEPRTNVLWLHYLAKKLLTSKQLAYTSSGSSAHPKGRKNEALFNKQLGQIEQTLNPTRRRFRPGSHSFKDFKSANDVISWAERQNYSV